jgi:hypothetical protein
MAWCIFCLLQHCERESALLSDACLCTHMIYTNTCMHICIRYILGGVAFRALAATQGDSLLMLTKEPASSWVREEALAAVEQV